MKYIHDTVGTHPYGNMDFDGGTLSISGFIKPTILPTSGLGNKKNG